MDLTLRYLVLWFLAVATLTPGAESLRFQDFEEGPCMPYRPQANFNLTWYANTPLPFVTGGSRYHLYHMTSGYPQHASMREFEFLYDSCLQSSINATTGQGSLEGFGAGEIGHFELRHTDRNGVFKFAPPPSTGIMDATEHVVSLTDNRSFVFFAVCWQGNNQRGWDVLSSTDRLDATTLKMIEDHAVSLGFDREQFLLLRYDSCNRRNGGERHQDLRRPKIGGVSWNRQGTKWGGK